NRHRLIDVTKEPFSADNTGATSAHAAIQKAVQAATADDVVYLPPGTYRLEAPINVGPTRSNITIRGAGEATVIDVRASGGAGVFNIGSSSSYRWDYHPVAITGGMTKG